MSFFPQYLLGSRLLQSVKTITYKLCQWVKPVHKSKVTMIIKYCRFSIRFFHVVVHYVPIHSVVNNHEQLFLLAERTKEVKGRLTSGQVPTMQWKVSLLVYCIVFHIANAKYSIFIPHLTYGKKHQNEYRSKKQIACPCV